MTTPAETSLWAIQARDCADPYPQIGSPAQARFVLATHAGHSGGCHQYLAALAYSRGPGARR